MGDQLHFDGPSCAFSLSHVYAALKRVEVDECVRWMVPFAMALRQEGDGSPMKTFPGILEDDAHNIQIHTGYMTLLVRVNTTTHTMCLSVSLHSKTDLSLQDIFKYWS